MSWLDTEITADHLALDNVESESATNALLAQGIGLFSNDVQIARAGRIQNVRGNELAKTSFTGNVRLTGQMSSVGESLRARYNTLTAADLSTEYSTTTQQTLFQTMMCWT